MNTDCLQCVLWNKAAIENGHDYGMCEDCFDKNYVAVKLYDEVKIKNEKGNENH
jgi:hypothetical protein